MNKLSDLECDFVLFLIEFINGWFLKRFKHCQEIIHSGTFFAFKLLCDCFFLFFFLFIVGNIFEFDLKFFVMLFEKSSFFGLNLCFLHFENGSFFNSKIVQGLDHFCKLRNLFLVGDEILYFKCICLEFVDDEVFDFLTNFHIAWEGKKFCWFFDVHEVVVVPDFITGVFLVCLKAELNLVFSFFLKDLELLSIFSLNA